MKKNMINTYEQSHQHIISLICLYSYIIYGIWSVCVCVCTLDVHAEAIIKSPRAWCHNLCKTNQTQQRVETLGMSLQLMIINLHFDGIRNWNMYNAEVYHHIIFMLNMASSWCVCACAWRHWSAAQRISNVMCQNVNWFFIKTIYDVYLQWEICLHVFIVTTSSYPLQTLHTQDQCNDHALYSVYGVSKEHLN